MEIVSEDVELDTFKPVFNRARGALDPSSPHARNAALLPFLLHVYACESGCIQILTSDFHSNTWHAKLSYKQLKDLRNELCWKDTFPNFLQNIHVAFSSNNVKLELGGPASAVGGKGATSASLKTIVAAVDASRDIVLPLEMLKGRCASDAIGALAFDLFDAFTAAQNQILELEAGIEHEKEKSTNVLNAIFEGKADSMYFRNSNSPSVVPNELQPSWSNATSPGLLIPSQSPPASVGIGSYLSPTLPPSLPSDFNSGYNLDLPHKTQKPSARVKLRKRRLLRNTALKLSKENSYSRSSKASETRPEHQTEVNNNNDTGVITPEMYETTGCSGDAIVSDVRGEKRIYRDIDANLLKKIELGGENRSAKTDAWARRHYLEWQRNTGIPEKEIEELPLPEFADSLVKFFCMVKKRNGDLFPSESLKAMYRGFVRIIQSHYKTLALQGKYTGPIVDPAKDIMFEKARISCIEAMKHSILEGANERNRKKTCNLLASVPEDFLSCTENQITTPKGLCRRLCYYCINKFGIDGNMELYDTTDIEFQRIVTEEGDTFWEYDEKRAEKYKTKVMFQTVVQCSDKDVVECLDKYFFHLPPKPLQEEPRRLFLAPIKRPTTNVWFRHQNLSSRTLQGWYKDMKPVLFHQLPSVKSSVQSSCAIRSDSNDLNTSLNPQSMHIGDALMTNVKSTQDTVCTDMVDDDPSNTDNDSTNNTGEDHDENDLTDVDTHD